MAGIEKVCEFSDEYIGPDMYEYKHNHIQIHPRYRKKFRGASHTLYIEKKTVYLRDKLGLIRLYDPQEKEEYTPPFRSHREYFDYVRYFDRRHVVNQFDFNLQIHDPELHGITEGGYRETTRHLPTLKRRLRRMLRCKTLNVVDLTDPKYKDLMKESVDKVLAHEERADRVAEAERIGREILALIQISSDSGVNRERILESIRDANLRWAIFSNELRNNRVLLPNDHFRKLVIETLPEHARDLGWV